MTYVTRCTQSPARVHFEGAHDKQQLRTSSRELSQLVGHNGHGYKKRSY